MYCKNIQFYTYMEAYAFFSLSLHVSSSLSRSVSLSFILSHSFSLFFPVSGSVCLSVSLPLSLSACFPFSSLCFTLFLYLSASISVSLHPCMSLCLYLSPSLSVTVSLYGIYRFFLFFLIAVNFRLSLHFALKTGTYYLAFFSEHVSTVKPR